MQELCLTVLTHNGSAVPLLYIPPTSTQPCGSNSPCILRAIRYGIHLGSEIPLLSGLVRPPFNPDVRDPRVRSYLYRTRSSASCLSLDHGDMAHKAAWVLAPFSMRAHCDRMRQGDVPVLLPAPCPPYGRQHWTRLRRALWMCKRGRCAWMRGREGARWFSLSACCFRNFSLAPEPPGVLE